jgi:hypothetical protein
MSLEPLYLLKNAQISERHAGIKSTSTYKPSRSIPCSSERTSQNLEPEAVDEYQPTPCIASHISLDYSREDGRRVEQAHTDLVAALERERDSSTKVLDPRGRTTNLASLDVQDFTHTINERVISAHCGLPEHAKSGTAGGPITCFDIWYDICGG